MLNLYERLRPQIFPMIDDALLAEMVAHIKPIVQVAYAGTNYRFRELLMHGVHLRRTAYLWDAHEKHRRGRAVQCYKGGLDNARIPIFATCGYYGFAKPSWAEVLACVKTYIRDWRDVRHVWVDTSEPLIVAGGAGHMMWATVFGPEDVAVQDATWPRFRQWCDDQAWVMPPNDRFVEYEPADELWMRPLGIGHERGDEPFI